MNSHSESSMAEPSDGEVAGGWPAALKRRLPASWPPLIQNAVVIGVGVALVDLLISIVGVGPVVFALVLGLIALLILLGVGLF